MYTTTAVLFIKSILPFCLIVALIVTACGRQIQEEFGTLTLTPTPTVTSGASTVIAKDDALLSEYDNSDREYKVLEIDEYIVYWHERMIDEAHVLGDIMRYVFDKETGELIEQEITWRDDLPEHLPPIITEEEARELAASMTEDQIKYADLVYISSGNSVLPITPTPLNPCWVVSAFDENGYNTTVIVIDAVTGEFLGYGVPVP